MGIRKNQSELHLPEKKKFVDAVLKLKAEGTYDKFVDWHVKAANHPTPPNGDPNVRNAAHMGPHFLPWHREFINRFELELQKIDSSITLPYWDWTVDNSENSSIWDDDFLGGDGSNSEHKVVTGPFAYDTGNWELTIKDDKGGDWPDPFLRRQLDTDQKDLPPEPALKVTYGLTSLSTQPISIRSTLPTTNEVDHALTVIPYDHEPWTASSEPNTSFRNTLEGWLPKPPPQLHNLVHMWVGGSMVTMSSPNDPVFFLHHSMIDRIWASWQQKHPDQGFLPVNGGPQGQNLGDAMFPWDTTAADVLDISSLGYSYDTLI